MTGPAYETSQPPNFLECVLAHAHTELQILTAAIKPRALG